MGKIYIITYYKSANYGSRLQAYALSHFLSTLGYDVRMLGEFRVPGSFLRHPTLLLARLYNKLHSRRRAEFYQPSPYLPDENRRRRLEKNFSESFREESFYNTRLWRQAIAMRPVFMVGSDIVWNPMQGYPSKFFLDFAVSEGLPCFSYAPSIGSKTIPHWYYGAIRHLVAEYIAVGVRENAAVEMMEQITKLPIRKNVDPTLLLSVQEWDEYAERAELSVEVSPTGYVFCYFVMDDPRYWEYVAKVAQSTGLQVIVLPMHYRDESQPYTVVLDGTPYEFVWLIKHAEFIVTDSFHACAFSVQYEKAFYLLRRTRKDEDSKYDDFLRRYGLLDRVVEDESSFTVKEETDYERVKILLSGDRSESVAFILDALRRC